MRRCAVVVAVLLKLFEITQTILARDDWIKELGLRAEGPNEVTRHRWLTSQRTERLSLQSFDFSGITTARTFEIEVLADRIVQQTHAGKPIDSGEERPQR